MSEFCDSPMKTLTQPSSGKATGGGTFDGEPGYPKRTSSPNAVPEKVREPITGSKDLNTDSPLKPVTK